MSNELLEFVHVLLEDPDDKETLNEFFDSFGTHAIMSVEMGDKFVAKTSFSQKDYQKNRHTGGSVSFNTELGIFDFIKAGVNTKSGFKDDAKRKGHSKMNTEEMFTIGTPLPKGKNLADKLETWISE